MSDQDFSYILNKYDSPVLLKKAGQKSVYTVLDPEHGKTALKLGKYDVGSHSLERIRREVATLKDIDSEFYPKNYDFEILEDGTFVILEEFIDSSSLKSKMAEFRDVKKALNLIRLLVTGLKELWDRKIVHRDLKPDNILIRPNGRPVIIDLGVVRALNLETLTATGVLGPGTTEFAAPEQFRAARRREIDARTDQFALGIILFMLITNDKHPFSPQLVGGGDLVGNIIGGRWNKQAINAKGFECVQDLIDRLLSVQPYDRFKNADLLLKSIDNCERTLQ